MTLSPSFTLGLKTVFGAAILASVLLVTPAEASNSKKQEAFKACAEKISAEFGRGKMTNARAKRLKSGYRVSMTKLNPEGDVLANVTCKIKKGEVVEFETSNDA